MDSKWQENLDQAEEPIQHTFGQTEIAKTGVVV
jgi:hypothetical protein